jgi:hypothetical protein
MIKPRKTRWARHVARMRKRRNAYRVLVEKSEGNRPLGKSRRRWEKNIRMDLGEVGWGSMEWTNLAVMTSYSWHLHTRNECNV